MKLLVLYEKLQLKKDKLTKKKNEVKRKKKIFLYASFFLQIQFLNFGIFIIRLLFLNFGDSSENYLIFTRLDKDSVLACNNSFCIYKKYQKKVRYLSTTVFAMILVTTIISSSFLYFMMPGKPVGKAATNNWNQSDWSLGADISALANHLADQTGWQKFFSKDANINVDTAGQVSLTVTTSSLVETTDADFAAGTHSNTIAYNNSALLLKPEGAACTVANECLVGSYCLAGVCSAPVSFVTIGAQVWMASNVNIGTMIAGSVGQANNALIEKYCYGDSEANCATDGGLYQWGEAMGYAASCNGTGESQPGCTTPVQGICPSGTHVPSHYEWTLLEKNVGSNPGAFPYDTTTTGWLGTNEGTNLKVGGSSDFNGLLAGYRYTDGSFNTRGTYSLLWSSTESGTSAWRRTLDSGNSAVYRHPDDKAHGFSVRCLKN